MVTRLTIPKAPALPSTPTPAAPSFIQRLLSFTIALAQDPGTNQPTTFEPGGADTVTLQGHRASVRIQNSGAPGGSTAQVDIFGMTLELMNQLATLGMVFKLIPRNTITILAGDEVSGQTPVFVGTIIQSYGDFNAAPNVPFHFECNSGVVDAVVPATPSSFPGSTDVATIMNGIASRAGYGFQNNGVNIKLPPSYFSGSLKTQWEKVRRDANINAELIGGVLTIWPIGGARDGAVPIIAPPPAGQMIGYPAYTQYGIIVETIFNPQIGFGGKVQVQGSQLKPANTTWCVNKLDHALDTLTPKGQWKSTIYGYNPNFPQPLPPSP